MAAAHATVSDTHTKRSSEPFNAKSKSQRVADAKFAGAVMQGLSPADYFLLNAL